MPKELKNKQNQKNHTMTCRFILAQDYNWEIDQTVVTAL